MLSYRVFLSSSGIWPTISFSRLSKCCRLGDRDGLVKIGRGGGGGSGGLTVGRLFLKLD